MVLMMPISHPRVRVNWMGLAGLVDKKASHTGTLASDVSCPVQKSRRAVWHPPLGRGVSTRTTNV